MALRIIAADALDRDLAVLESSAGEWVTTSVAEKRRLLEGLRVGTAAVAEEWVRASCEAKGIGFDAPAAGEEWMSGPYALLATVGALVDSLGEVDAGRSPLEKVTAKPRPNGQISLRVFPAVPQDRVLNGYRGDVWLRPGVTVDQARAGAARALRDTDRPGAVTVVLGAGNINSIPPLDMLSKLYQDGAVVLLKLNPVNDYLAAVLDRVFAGFVEGGFVRITSGGRDVGSYLVNHPAADTLHITGSRASHDAIVLGPGGEVVIDKPVTSELGGVGPVIVVPGRWSDGALREQAENVATQRLHNSGFNCIATQIVVLPDRWPQASRFLGHVRRALRNAPARPAYYPGAADRQRAAMDQHERVETLGGDPLVPRTLLTGLNPDEEEPAFTDEYFGPVLGVTRLPGADAAEFLERAVEFCNDRLAGDLGAGIIAAPRTIRRLRGRFERAVSRLRYGAVAINCWVGPIYGMPRATWGAFPGHDVEDAGSGIGLVHNALLIDPDHVERSVGRGPFRPWPKPVWYVTNRTAHITGEHMTRFAAAPSLARGFPSVMAAARSSLRG